MHELQSLRILSGPQIHERSLTTTKTSASEVGKSKVARMAVHTYTVGPKSTCMREGAYGSSSEPRVLAQWL